MSRKETITHCLEIWNDPNKTQQLKADEINEYLIEEEYNVPPRKARSIYKQLVKKGIPEVELDRIKLFIEIKPPVKR